MNKNDRFHEKHSMSKEDFKKHMSEESLEEHTSDEALEKMGKMTTVEIVNEHMELLKKDGNHSEVDEEVLRTHIEEMVKAHTKEDFEKFKSKKLTSEDIVKIHHHE
ncbi:MAG: hypothetical protein FH751_00335 [Firmicutes bacterium]|nr:hypothetical protein [Bacillota bacterium]